ncbi:protein lifeguard 1-like [Pecten maximus]|uniref:protein lifeguard 1-like n=1 Tax=Pecten maximus TaxID=6579 RepID=UPI001458B801|nr:protein lifeguard 1-like [Pecten maximus]
MNCYDSSPGGIVGGVVGGLFGLGTLIALIVVCVCCRRRQANAGTVFGNRSTTAVTMVTQQNTAYPAGQSGYPQPVVGQAGYPAAPMGQYGTPTPVGNYPTSPQQQPYPVGTQAYPQQAYPQQAPAYNPGNAYDPNTAPMAGGGPQINQGFQPPPSYDSVTTEKQ